MFGRPEPDGDGCNRKIKGINNNYNELKIKMNEKHKLKKLEGKEVIIVGLLQQKQVRN